MTRLEPLGQDGTLALFHDALRIARRRRRCRLGGIVVVVMTLIALACGAC